MSDKAFALAVAEISFAFERVPFFREHMTRAGVTPSELRSPEDLSRIPLTRKSDYRRHFPVGVLARGRRVTEQLLHRSQSSGTEGERLVTVGRPHLFAKRLLQMTSVHPGFGFVGKPSTRTVRYAAPNCSDVECATPSSTMADRTLPDGTLVLSVLPDLFATPARTLAENIRELREFQPTFLYADATHLSFLSRFMKATKESPPDVKAIALTYSLPTAIARRQLHDVFGSAPAIAEVSSMSEFGWVGMECPSGGMHLNVESFVFELVTSDGEPAKRGSLGELVITSVRDQVSPHIRYATGDLYRWLETPCACGVAAPLVRLEGRRSNMCVIGEDVVLSPRDVDDAIGAPAGLHAYQLEQRDDGELLLRYMHDGTVSPDALGVSLRENLRSADALVRSLTIVDSSYIESDASGKFMSCRSAPAQRLTAASQIRYGVRA